MKWMEFWPGRGIGRIEKIEVTVATVALIVALVEIFNQELSEGDTMINYLFEGIKIGLIYISFLLLDLIILPNLFERKFLVGNLILTFGIITILFTLFPNEEVLPFLILFTIFFLLKYSIIAVSKKIGSLKRKKGVFFFHLFVMGAFLLIVMFLMLAGNATKKTFVVPGIIIPGSILLYSVFYGFIFPIIYQKNKSKDLNVFYAFNWRILIAIIVSSIILGSIGALLTGDENTFFILFIVNSGIQVLFTVPVSWNTYGTEKKNRKKIKNLRQELGNSTAQFDFLRSQINPHFLFNVLNTVYCSALQEGAEKTGEAIQKLSEMMRFMLHHNTQEKIRLDQELSYLNNYINLQRLRTDPNPNINIEISIDSLRERVLISPMLLIPFVENAFKHGISLRSPSYVKVIMKRKNTELHFKVLNSKHKRLKTDPERMNSGIGLQNVRQRLDLLYHNTHNLIVVETEEDFKIHLILELFSNEKD